MWTDSSLSLAVMQKNDKFKGFSVEENRCTLDPYNIYIYILFGAGKCNFRFCKVLKILTKWLDSGG
jgi:hypothetical protein